MSRIYKTNSRLCTGWVKPMGNQQLNRAVVMGAVAAAALIGLFLLVYWLLGTVGASQSVQLFGALLAPPALLGVGLAVVAQMRAKK